MEERVLEFGKAVIKEKKISLTEKVLLLKASLIEDMTGL